MIYPNRMKTLMQEGIFLKLHEIKDELIKEGREVINLSVGSPDINPAPHVMQTLISECEKYENYRYAITDIPELREAAACWYKRRFQVELDAHKEITSLMGSQEGLSHICLALTDVGDLVMVHNPGYPVYHAGPQIAQNEMYYMPTRENSALIDFDAIPKDIAKRAKLMIVSYPNNPTAQTADDDFYTELVEFANKHEILIVHDNAYCELTFDGYKCGSFLQHDGAKDVGIELNSLSKTYNLAGIRVGFALGNKDMIKCISAIKSHMDYGIFVPIQKAAIAALLGDQSGIEKTKDIYQKRRDTLCDGLNALGWEVEKPKATMFVWAKLPKGYESSDEFVMMLAKKTGVVVTPGSAFGEKGEGFVRMALVQSCEQMEKAIVSIGKSDIFAEK